MSLPVVLPVTIYGDAEAPLNQAAQESIARMRAWVENGGLNVRFSARGDGALQELRGSDVANVVVLARLFLQEHPTWPESAEPSTMSRYRKKPVEVEAIQWSVDNFEECLA